VGATAACALFQGGSSQERQIAHVPGWYAASFSDGVVPRLPFGEFWDTITLSKGFATGGRTFGRVVSGMQDDSTAWATNWLRGISIDAVCGYVDWSLGDQGDTLVLQTSCLVVAPRLEMKLQRKGSDFEGVWRETVDSVSGEEVGLVTLERLDGRP
jgi:hypothetical protein